MSIITIPDVSTNNSSVNLDLVEILQSAIKNMNIKGEISLNTNEVVFMETVMKENPDAFKNISAQITDILNSRKIEISDIPHIIYVISTIYLEHFKCKDINIIDCIKFTIDTIIDSGLLPINGRELAILKTVVDNSLNLLKMNIPIIEEEIEIIDEPFIKRLFNFLHNYRCCCH